MEVNLCAEKILRDLPEINFRINDINVGMSFKEEIYMAKVYGYTRVSTRDQNGARQIIALTQYGVERKNIICDEQSGKNFERPGYRRLIKILKEGDTLVIKSIDRLGRNYDEIIKQWQILTKEIRVGIVVLDMPLLDTRQGKDLTGTLIADIVLQLLSYVAQTEREMILQRQKEGIAAAKSRGVHFGRKAMDRPQNYQEYKEAWLAGKISTRQAAYALGISHTSFRNWVKNDG